MQRKYQFLILFSVAGLVGSAGCRNAVNQKATATSSENTASQTAMATTNINRAAGVPLPQKGKPNQIPPGTSRLIGEIMAISPERSPDKHSPCGKAPCQAQVKIKKILGYGAAFGAPLQEGQEIPVHFTFTLGPTTHYFPELTEHLPGLQVGSTFQTDVKASGENKRKYTITDYTLLKGKEK